MSSCPNLRCSCPYSSRTKLDVALGITRILANICVALLAVAAAVFGSIAAWPTTVPSVCKSDLAVANWFDPFCDHEYDQIEPQTAKTALMRFYGQAGGAEPRRAWLLLTDEQRLRVPLSDFEQLWTPYSWAEVFGDVEKVDNRFNVFRMEVRYYEADGDPSLAKQGKIIVLRNIVGLRLVNGAIRVDEEIVDRRISTTSAKYPRPRLISNQKTYNTPVVDNDNFAMQASKDTTDDLLSLLCVLDEPSMQHSTRKDEIDRWLRTPQGWLPATATPSFDSAELPLCDSAYAEADY